jgi:hypothetical protein
VTKRALGKGQAVTEIQFRHRKGGEIIFHVTILGEKGLGEMDKTWFIHGSLG